MPYVRVKCPRGHSFHTHVYSKYQKVTCPECHREAARNYAAASAASDDGVPNFTMPSVDFSLGDTGSSSSSSDFSSGGGGDFSGGGGGSSWD